MIQRADTVGVFQIESRAQMATLPRMKPAQLLRPRGRDRDHPPRPDRRPDGASLSEPPRGPRARGLSASLAGADPSAHARRADLPGAAAAAGDGGGGLQRRRGRGAAPRDGLQALGGAHGAASRSGLRAGMAARGILGAAQDEIVRGITSFALYGFPESHSASFALIAYASAYLRAHHPAAFLAGLLNAWPMGFYSPATLVKDAERHGVAVRRDRRRALAVALHLGGRRSASRPALRARLLRRNGGAPRRRARAHALRVARRSRRAAPRPSATRSRRSPNAARSPRSTRAPASAAPRSGR